MSYPWDKPEDLWAEAGRFSDQAFGPPSFRGPLGPLDHLAKEVREAQANPGDLEEYADCLLLVFDAARRAGFTIYSLFDAALAKTEINKARTWPDWRTADPTKALEHDRASAHQRPPLTLITDHGFIRHTDEHWKWCDCPVGCRMAGVCHLAGCGRYESEHQERPPLPETPDQTPRRTMLDEQWGEETPEPDNQGKLESLLEPHNAREAVSKTTSQSESAAPSSLGERSSGREPESAAALRDKLAEAEGRVARLEAYRRADAALMQSCTCKGRPESAAGSVPSAPPAERLMRLYEETSNECAELETKLAQAEKERDAYKRAKGENDDRYMIERDEARAQVASLVEALHDLTDAAEDAWPNRPCVRVARAALAKAKQEK